MCINILRNLNFYYFLIFFVFLFGYQGNTDDCPTPKLVDGLSGVYIVQVCCGSEDAHTLALDDTGKVWSWGDGEYGKLGRGGADSCKVPKLITNWETTTPIIMTKIFCGCQMSMALTKSGQLYSWLVSYTCTCNYTCTCIQWNLSNQDTLK